MVNKIMLGTDGKSDFDNSVVDLEKVIQTDDVNEQIIKRWGF